MAVSVRMNPLLEKELALAAQRQGMSKSQFIIAAVERAIGRKNPHDLLVALQAEEEGETQPAAAGSERPYDTAASKAAVRARLKIKHDGRSAG